MKKLLKLLAPKVADKVASMEKVKKLHQIFCKYDCTMLEVTSAYVLRNFVGGFPSCSFMLTCLHVMITMK
ncbi:hypothetical protein MKW92_029850 [Papaver armeniacum]|nr:hypothetical protein MKW92_029850 [Papaver armeniacum]